MVSQAKEASSLPCRFGQTRHAGWKKLAQIVIADEVKVQSKNLFRLKGSLGQCLVDANTTQHLPLCGELLRALRHL
jgi:hypothetical protein